jgi:hypothetical protein
MSTTYLICLKGKEEVMTWDVNNMQLMKDMR